MIKYLFLALLFCSCNDRSSERFNVPTMKTEVRVILNSSHEYFTYTGRYPEDVNEFVYNTKRYTGWQRIFKDVPIDPWGNKYIIDHTDTHITIRVKGKEYKLSELKKSNLNKQNNP